MTKRIFFFLKALIAINFLVIVAFAFMMPLWSDFVRSIGGDLRTAGNAIAIFSVVIGIVTCYAGRLESYLKREEAFLVISQVIMCLGYLGYFFVSHPWQLYLVQVVLGVGGAFQSPALCALYQRFIPPHKSAHHWGVWNGFYQIGMGVGALASAYVVQHKGFMLMFSILFVVSLLCLLWSIYVARQIKNTPQTIPAGSSA